MGLPDLYNFEGHDDKDVFLTAIIGFKLSGDQVWG